MKAGKMQLNLMSHMAFTMALYNVSTLFDETDNYPLARQVELAGFITEAEVEAMSERLGSADLTKPVSMTFEDILLLYTVMDLNAKLMLSHKGEQLREELNLDSDLAARQQTKEGFEGLIKMSAVFVRSVAQELDGDPRFDERKLELEKLNAFI